MRMVCLTLLRPLGAGRLSHWLQLNTLYVCMWSPLRCVTSPDAICALVGLRTVLPSRSTQ